MQKDGTTLIKGMYSEVWKVLEQRLNFTTDVTKVVCGNCSKYTVMKNAVANNEYDLALTGNSLTHSRSKTFDFSYPIVPTSLRLFYVKSSAGSSHWFVYFESFLFESWIGTVCTTSVAFLLYLILQFLSTKVKKP